MAAETTHPTWSEIDAIRTGEGEPAHREHLHSCPECQAHLATLSRLANDLAAPLSPIDVPDEVDARILWNARKRAQAARKTAPPKRRLAGTRWAIAASIALVLGAVGLWERARSAPEQVARLSEDIDGNGTIDIRDAFMLAKAIQGGRTDQAWDVDGDNSVDMHDVDRIGQRAVMIRRQG